MNIVNEVLVYCLSKGYEIEIRDRREKDKLVYKGPPVLDWYDFKSPRVPAFATDYMAGGEHQIETDYFLISAWHEVTDSEGVKSRQCDLTWTFCSGSDDGISYWDFLEVNGVKYDGYSCKGVKVDAAMQSWLDERAIVKPYLRQFHQQIRRLDNF
tara:strand:+ start:11 stop:475 length:465 start_codon:yes stop_codon:yes gene_type:complete